MKKSTKAGQKEVVVDIPFEKLGMPLTSRELKALDRLLIKKVNISVFQAHGFLCAVANNPHSEEEHEGAWLLGLLKKIQLLNGSKINNRLITLIMRLRDHIGEMLMRGTFVPLIDYPSVSLFSWESFTQEQKTNIRLWSLGYVNGIEFDAKRLTVSIPKMFAMVLMSLYALSDLNNKIKTSKTDEEKERIFSTITKNLPAWVQHLYNSWLFGKDLVKDKKKECCFCGKDLPHNKDETVH